jgi:hypothetical protein
MHLTIVLDDDRVVSVDVSHPTALPLHCDGAAEAVPLALHTVIQLGLSVR